LQAINCTGTDNQKTRQQKATYARSTKEKQKQKTALANKTIYTMIWQPTPSTTSGQETERVLFLEARSPDGAKKVHRAEWRITQDRFWNLRLE